MTSRGIDSKRAALLAILSDRCFLCDGSYLEANPVVLHKIFDERGARKYGQTKHATLSDVLTSAIGRQLDQSEVHSSILCGNCYNKVVEYERFEQQLEYARQRILNAYQQTVKHYLLSQTSNDDIRHSVDESSEYFVESINIEESAIEYCPVDDDEHDAEETKELEEEVEDVGEGEGEEEETLLDIDVVGATSNCKVATDTENIDELTGVEFLLDDNDDMNAKSGEEDVASSNDLIEQTSPSQCQSTSDSARDHKRCSTNVISKSRKTVKQSDDNEIILEDHILFLRDDDRFKCQVCEVSQWQILKDFTEHMEKSHKNCIDACPLCREVFFSNDKLDEHIYKDHNDVTSFECSECRRVFPKYRLLEKHARTHEVHAQQYNYEIYSDKFSNKSTLILHLTNSHANVKSYKCNECDKVFATKSTLKKHLNFHKDQPLQFQCDECDGVFTKRYSLTKHKKLHVKSKDFICKVCAKSFTTQHYLDVHSIVHSGERPYVCGTCGKGFARSGDMKDHERIHTGERPFKCEICDMAFAQRSNLMSHMKLTHLNQRLHKCTQCNRSFKRRRLLDYHVHSQHTGERPHVCETCGASFVYPDHLKKHRFIHTGKRPFACEVCGKQFNSRENRNSHHFVHSDKKPYECVDCGAGFMRKPQLFYHLQQYKHSDDTIILNQPQLKKGIVSKIVPNDASIQYINDNEENTLESTILDNETIVEEIDDSVTVKSNEDMIDDNVSEIKYLELDEENNDEFTWAIMKENE